MKLTQLSYLAATAVMLTISACSKPQTSEPAGPGATESRNELAARAGAPLFDGMGSHHHAITTSDPDAQRYFDQGLVIDFAFNHAESVRSLRWRSLDTARAIG